MEKKTKRPILYYTDSRPKLSEYTRMDLVERPQFGEVVYFGGYGPSDFTAFIKFYTSKVTGPKIYYKEVRSSSLTVKDGRIYGSLTSGDSLDSFTALIIKVFHLDWITPWARKLLGTRRDLWAQVLTGKITNSRKLAAFFSRKYFGGAYSTPSLKRFFSHMYTISLWDLYYYTTNPEVALQNVCCGNGIHMDLLKYCKMFSSKMNPAWSAERCHLEEQKFIEQKMLIDMEKKHIDDTHLTLPYEEEGLSLILNEKECFIEGCLMHNCVHTNYWESIYQGNYLIARGSFFGDYIDLGIRILWGDIPTIYVDQVYRKYNSNPYKSTIRFCTLWVENHKEILLAIAQEIKMGRFVKKKPSFPPEEVEDIPF